MWEQKGTLYYGLGPRWLPGRPVVAFDFDGTLSPFRGRGAPAQKTRAVLRVLSATWNVAIFSNQSGSRAAPFAKIEDFVRLLIEEGGSCDTFVATSSDRYRKPQTGAWEVFSALRFPAGEAAPGPASFFCGDAAGREGDFSACDRWFAHNVGLRFRVPEQLFGALSLMDPPPPLRSALAEFEDALGRAARGENAWAETVEAVAGFDVVLMVGSPASGKSTFARRLVAAKGFRSVSQDCLGSAAACGRRLGTELAEAGVRVVVDNTLPTRPHRERYAAAARAARPGARVAAVWIRTPQIFCRHLDGLRCHRDATGRTKLLPVPALRGFWARFEAPDAQEAASLGFELFRLDFGCLGPPGDLAEKRFAEA